MYKVLLVDDEALIREAISENIQWEELGFSFMGACENGKQAIEMIEKEQPNLLLTDINMPFVDGMELTKFVYENYPDTKVIVISGFDEFEYAKNAVKYQVLEYILKPITPMEFLETFSNNTVKSVPGEDSGQRRAVAPPMISVVKTSLIVKDTYRFLVILR